MLPGQWARVVVVGTRMDVIGYLIASQTGGSLLRIVILIQGAGRPGI